jgi:hypothetical protein
MRLGARFSQLLSLRVFQQYPRFAIRWPSDRPRNLAFGPAQTSNNENSLVQAIRQGASQSFNQTGEQVVGRSLNVQPTITIRPGFPVRVLVTHDLVLEPYAEVTRF